MVIGQRGRGAVRRIGLRRAVRRSLNCLHRTAINLVTVRTRKLQAELPLVTLWTTTDACVGIQLDANNRCLDIRNGRPSFE
jgi:hypothetical protein